MTLNEIRRTQKYVRSDLKAELFNLRFQHTVNQLENPLRLNAVRKDIARVKTVLNEKNA